MLISLNSVKLNFDHILYDEHVTLDLKKKIWKFTYNFWKPIVLWSST